MFGLLDQASTVAGQVDFLLLVLILLSMAFAVPVAGLVVYFGLKYHRGSKANRYQAPGTLDRLEIIWSVGPLCLALIVFAWSTSIFLNMYRPPADATEIYVVGKQWMWKIQHPEGPREIDELHVPVNRPIKLTMTSEDVIHDFFIPAFRVKQDVLPGRYTSLWFQATKIGEYHLFCSQYCGTDHALMGGKVIVMDQTAYADWLANGSLAGGGQSSANQGQSLASAGEQLFQQLGCSGCHNPNGKGVGPSLAGIYNKPQPLADGTTVIADDTYLRESIVQPQAKIVAGYGPPSLMPSFQGRVSEEQILQLINYIKSQGSAAATGANAGNAGTGSGTSATGPIGGATSIVGGQSGATTGTPGVVGGQSGAAVTPGASAGTSAGQPASGGQRGQNGTAPATTGTPGAGAAATALPKVSPTAGTRTASVP